MATNDSGTYFDLNCGAVPNFKTPSQYIKAKLKMLREEMYIEPTVDEIIRLNSLVTEEDINIAVRGIIDRHWN